MVGFEKVEGSTDRGIGMLERSIIEDIGARGSEGVGAAGTTMNEGERAGTSTGWSG
jgi:hypothetical protein